MALQLFSTSKKVYLWKKVLFICKNLLIHTILHRPIYCCIVIQKRQYIDPPKLCIIAPLIPMVKKLLLGLVPCNVSISQAENQVEIANAVLCVVNCVPVHALAKTIFAGQTVMIDSSLTKTVQLTNQL